MPVMMLEQNSRKSRSGPPERGLSGSAGMRARGKLAVFAGIAALLMASTSFSERRNIMTWAPNAVIIEAKPTKTRITLAARPDPAPRPGAYPNDG
jgi:hypothetical protein